MTIVDNRIGYPVIKILFPTQTQVYGKLHDSWPALYVEHHYLLLPLILNKCGTSSKLWQDECVLSKVLNENDMQIAGENKRKYTYKFSPKVDEWLEFQSWKADF